MLKCLLFRFQHCLLLQEFTIILRKALNSISFLLNLCLTTHHFQSLKLVFSKLYLLSSLIKIPIHLSYFFETCYFFKRLFDPFPHPAVLHNAFLHIFNMNILLHTDIFLHEIFQLDIHFKRDCPFKQSGKFLHIQSTQVHFIELPSEPLIARPAVISLLWKRPLQVFSDFHSRKTSFVCPIMILKKSSCMPEKQSSDFIRRSFHVKHNADTLFFLCVCLFKLQHDRTGKIGISQILCFIIFTDIDHAPQVLNQ